MLTEPLISKGEGEEDMRDLNSHLIHDDGGNINFTDSAMSSLYAAFLKHDTNGDGAISRKEIESVLNAAHVRLTKAKKAELLSHTGHDDKLDFNEFCSYMKELIADIAHHDAGVKQETSAFELQDLGDMDSADPRKILWCLTILFAYLGLGISYGYFRRGWRILDSVYFCVVTMTTVGYGDYGFNGPTEDPLTKESMPLTDWRDKIFGGIFVFVGVGSVGSSIVTLMEEIQAKAEARMQNLKQGWASSDDDGPAQGEFDFEAEKKKLYCQLFKSFLAIILTVAAGTVVMANLQEDWTYSIGFYWACVSMTTVGYGDYLPTSDATKFFTIMYILVSFSLVVTAISLIGSFPFELKRLKQINQVLHQFGEDLDKNELQALLGCEELNALRTDEMKKDRETRPGVSRAEFSLWLLMKQEKISLEDDVLMTLKVFDKLDPDRSGELDEEDIKYFMAMAGGSPSPESDTETTVDVYADTQISSRWADRLDTLKSTREPPVE